MTAWVSTLQNWASLRRRSMPRGVFAAAGEDVGLHAEAEQFFDGVLGGFGFEFFGGAQVGDEGEVDDDAVFAPEIPAQLAHRLDVGQRFDIAHSAAEFGNDYVEPSGLPQQEHAAFDFVGDMGDDLHRFAKVGALALALDYRLVNGAGSDVVGARGGHVEEAFVVSEIEIGFGAVLGHIAFAVFVGIERPRIDVDVWVKFLNCDG